MKEKYDLIKKAPHGFCLAKWYQVTIDLTTGFAHSCHHPDRHKIPISEIEKTPMALHNTHFKMLQRKKMLNGVRPEECKYCWDIEDLNKDQTDMFISDRFIKSTDFWAFDKLDETIGLSWDVMVSPTYLEVILSSECNLNCAYCVADISSAIKREMIQHGPYPVKSEQRRIPSFVEKDDEINSYRKAFWEFLPMIYKDLKVFRITGGEPLLSGDTFKILDFFETNPNSSMKLAINTNLSYSSQLCERLLSKIEALKNKNCIEDFSIFISLDSFGPQATYARHGLNLESFLNNFRKITQSAPETEIVVMCTYNILSIFNFLGLLVWIEEQKKAGVKITLDVSYLKNPFYLMANIIDDKSFNFVLESLKYMKMSSQFTDYERKKFERIVKWIESEKNLINRDIYRADFYSFINEYDRRFNRKFLDIFPECSGFYNLCKKTYIMLT